MKPEIIDSPSRMDELLVRLHDCDLIAVDTEFFRETTYFPQLALVQIATDTIVACIDPLAFDARPYLKKLLLELPITKIFHSCSQDMEVLFYYLGKTPTSIYDTQIANALLTENQQIGYSTLVENELGVQLDKSQTRTNWLQRPLTDNQIQYAGDDVFYLYRLHDALEKKLSHTGRKQWFAEESSRIDTDQSDYQVDEDKLWKRVKGSTKLNRKDLAIVQAAAKWREHLARQKNKTRKKILSDETIIQLALTPPEDINRLSQLLDKRYSFDIGAKQQLIMDITKAQQSSAVSWPDNRFNMLDKQQKAILKSLQQLVNSKAEKLGISSAVLCSRKDLEKLILFYTDNDKPTELLPDMPITSDWRFHCIGQQLTETVKDAIKIGN